MTNYATAKQIDLINTLGKERVLPEGMSISTTGLTISGASSLITSLFAAPKKPRDLPGAVDLTAIPKSKYAVPFEDIAGFLVNTKTYGNDLLFIELKEYRGRRRLLRLHGSLGAFSRSRIDSRDLKGIVTHIEKNPEAFARLFGEHYSCCGCCGAELTDQRSRELLLGPECRKRFGYAK